MKKFNLVFDLDDTLYLEIDFIKSGFFSVSSIIEECSGIDKKYIYEELIKSFLNKQKSFNYIVEQHSKILDFFSVNDLIDIYRFHYPLIKPIPEMILLLDDVQKISEIGLISDGWLRAQKNKIQALGVGSYFKKIIFTDFWGRGFWKPHERAFVEVEKEFESNLCIYIADNPKKDFIQPNKRGWKSVRIRLPQQIYGQEELSASDRLSTREVTSVSALRSLLREWGVLS